MAVAGWWSDGRSALVKKRRAKAIYLLGQGTSNYQQRHWSRSVTMVLVTCAGTETLKETAKLRERERRIRSKWRQDWCTYSHGPSTQNHQLCNLRHANRITSTPPHLLWGDHWLHDTTLSVGTTTLDGLSAKGKERVTLAVQCKLDIVKVDGLSQGGTCPALHRRN